jgi:hypothetical protein
MLRGRNHRDQRLVHEPGQHVERHARGDGAGGVGIESPDEHGHAPKRGLLDRIEKGVAPLDRGSNAAVVRGCRPSRAAQFTHVGVETGDDLVRRHDADPGGCQLNAERELVDPGADVEYGGLCVFIRNQLRTSFPGALQKQAVCMLRLKRLQPPHRLTRDAERLAAGCQNTKLRAGTEQRHTKLRARVEDMLTVVEHQQHVPIGQIPPYGVSRRVPRGAANVEHPRRLSRYVFGATHRGKIDEPDAIGSLPGLTTTEFDSRSGLAYAGWAGQRHQPGSVQHVANGLELRCATDQPCERRGYRRSRPVRSIVFARLFQPIHH